MARGGRTDAEGRWQAIRTRLGAISGTQGPPGPAGQVRLVWRGAWADGDDYHEGDIVYRDHGLGSGLVRTYISMEDHTAAGDGPTPGGTSIWHEFNESDLIIDGSRAMVGTLNMNHNDIANAKDVEVEGDETFTGGVGVARIESPRVISMAGADTDDEGLIENINRTVFNPVSLPDGLQSVGVLAYDGDHEEFAPHVKSGDDPVALPVGWSVISCINHDGGTISAGVLVEVTWDALTAPDRPRIKTWAPDASEQPALLKTHRVVGVTMTASNDTAGDMQVLVMRRGVSLDIIQRPISETWALGDLLWGKSDGSVTNVKPTAPAPIVLVGTVFHVGGEAAPSVLVDVRIMPSLGELSGVLEETPEDLDVFIHKAADDVWEPRRLELRDLADGRRYTFFMTNGGW